MQRALAASRQGFGTALADAGPMTGGLLTGHSHDYIGGTVRAPCAGDGVGLAFVAASCMSKLGEANRRAAAPWLCGYAPKRIANRYVAHNFYGEIKRYFRWVGGAPAPEPHEPPILKER